MGEKHINKIAPKIPGQSCEHFIYVFCSLCVFFRSIYLFFQEFVCGFVQENHVMLGCQMMEAFFVPRFVALISVMFVNLRGRAGHCTERVYSSVCIVSLYTPCVHRL